jgi:SAM-dependent methyltransferase
MSGPEAAYRRLRFRVGARVLAHARALRRHRLALAERFLRGEGVEVGALHLPLPLPAGTRARYVDRYDRAGLRKAYPELAGTPIVDVDVVDDGERLSSLGDESQDFVVANHFYEHTEDPIGTLGHHLRVVRPGGIVFMAIPDKRLTFDADRPVTPLDHHVADHERGPAISRRDHFEEWARLVDGVPEAEVAGRAARLDAEDYSIHFHVWVPQAFIALLEHCRAVEALPFETEAVQPALHEFAVVLRKTAAQPASTRS